MGEHSMARLPSTPNNNTVMSPYPCCGGSSTTSSSTSTTHFISILLLNAQHYNSSAISRACGDHTREGFRNMDGGFYCTWTLMFGDLHNNAICSLNILHQGQRDVHTSLLL